MENANEVLANRYVRLKWGDREKSKKENSSVMYHSKIIIVSNLLCFLLSYEHVSECILCVHIRLCNILFKG